MKNTDWKKITQRPLTSEEKKEYGDEIEFMWDGKIPELDEEVLVYQVKVKKCIQISGLILTMALVLKILVVMLFIG